MTAQEVRIGNLTNFGKVYEIQQDKFYVMDDKDSSISSAWAEIEPIPLTEDWLERFGFERLVGWLDVWRKDGFDRFELTEIHDEYFFNDTKIEFVHQIQNAFFCIEQTELTPSEK